MLEHGVHLAVRAFAAGILKRTSSPDRAETVQGFIQLRMPKFFHAIGLVILVPPLLLFWKTMTSSYPVSDTIILVILGLIVQLVGAEFLLEGMNHKVLFNAERFYVTDLFGRTKAHAWSEVRSIRSTGASAVLKIRFADGTKVRVSQYLLGMRTFIDSIERGTGTTLIGGINPIIWWIG